MKILANIEDKKEENPRNLWKDVYGSEYQVIANTIVDFCNYCY